MQSNESSPGNGSLPVAADDLVRRLGRRYLLALCAVACLVVADQALIQPLLLRMNGFAPAINLAGRQRMLSQKLAKAALGLESATAESSRAVYRAELRDSLREWTGAHEALQRPAADRRFGQLTSPAIDEAWTQLQPHFYAMRAAADLLQSQTALSSEEMLAEVRAIVEHEPLFLRNMEHLVSLMEAQSVAETSRLRLLAFAVASTIIVLVGAVGWFVIRPATGAIRGQVNQLEYQVAQRTRKLDEMLVALLSEVVERQASQARNQLLAAQLAHANRVETVGHMAAGLAHELNQPFATIVNYAEASNVVLEQSLDVQGQQRLQDFIERIRQASLRAGSIVRRIRNFVQPGANPTIPTDLVALVHEVVALCHFETQRARTTLVLQPTVAGEIVVQADPIQIQQVLVNLIHNALHAVQDNAPSDRRIVLHVKEKADAVQIDVVDNGRGLGGVDTDTLFTPFHTTKADGLGIGLSICRSIIEQHQGTIWAQSLSSQGTQFSFVLPRSVHHAVDDRRSADSVCR